MNDMGCVQLHWPDRYVPLFGQGAYDPEKERDEVPFEEQLQGIDDVIRAGKVGAAAHTAMLVMSSTISSSRH